MRAPGFSGWMLPGVILLQMLALTPPAMAQTPTKPSAAKMPGAEEFKTVPAATAHCPGDTVVWSSLSSSKAFHLPASRYFGKTKHGAYVCEKDAIAAGFHASKR